MPDSTTKQLGLPAGVRACLFDLDGVLTRTAVVHSAAWKEMFDEFLSARSRAQGEPFVPFDIEIDYLTWVDGRPRADGTRSFLASRGITLPEGTHGDPPGGDTVIGLGNRKNELVTRHIREKGVEVYRGSLRYLQAVREAGLMTALVSSSANAADILRVTGLEKYLDVCIDGLVARERGLPGKPAPDTFLEAAKDLGVTPGEGAVYEDALSGVAAGAAGGFRAVVGVDREGQADKLREQGATVVVPDLEDLLGA
ncbi:MAG: hypothetical protein QG608_3099 [Actinomycetota bacterium]|nr:hypothetical protein [Actinomycetota bacterium]